MNRLLYFQSIFAGFSPPVMHSPTRLALSSYGPSRALIHLGLKPMRLWQSVFALALVCFPFLSVAHAAAIKAVQRGSVSAASGTNRTAVTLPAGVDPAKTCSGLLGNSTLVEHLQWSR